VGAPGDPLSRAVTPINPATAMSNASGDKRATTFEKFLASMPGLLIVVLSLGADVLLSADGAGRAVDRLGRAQIAGAVVGLALFAAGPRLAKYLDGVFRLAGRAALVGCAATLVWATAVVGSRTYEAWTKRDLISLNVVLGTRSVAKFPFVIAYDQGLFEKHGLNVELWMPEADFAGTIDREREEAPPRPDITVDGTTPMMIAMIANAWYPRRVVLGATDCIADDLVVGGPGIRRLEDLAGKRIGTSSGVHTTTTYTVLLLAQRMGWDPIQDISIMTHGDLAELRLGLVDGFTGIEEGWSRESLASEGFTVLADMTEWGEPHAGTGIRVEPEWLEQPGNRDAARRFIMATAEGIALFHQNRELAFEIAERWHGFTGERAEQYYETGMRILPRKPFPCYDGIRKTMELYDSNAMRQYQASDFWDDALVREIDAAGFFDSLYGDPTD
jgi:ABC-type nitrate/sulfonate/bicarbonate transport system substrate-binding protein